ncbi:hypothetical protein SOVF_095040 [Spinacia oleracea]|nr:hypothetical protein SOVF_095040 [Spinacia oleracea]
MGCAKKLFITKKKKEVEKGEVECVNEMMKKLETVSLCVEEEVQGEGVKQIATHAGQTRGSDGESKEIRVTKQGLLPGSEVGQDTKKVGGNGTDEVGKVTEVTGDNVVRQVEPTGASLLPPLNFSVGCSSSTTGRSNNRSNRTKDNHKLKEKLKKFWGEDHVCLVRDFTGNWKDPIKAVHKGGPRFEIEIQLPKGNWSFTRCCCCRIPMNYSLKPSVLSVTVG